MPLTQRRRRDLRRVIIAMGSLLSIGVVYAWLVLGSMPLDPANTAWLKGDSVEYHLAARFARQTTGWHVPLTWTDRVGAPLGSYLSLVDPATILVMGPVARLLPAGWQLFGLFFAVNAAAQLYWGARLAALLAGGGRAVALAGGALALLSPIMAVRGLNHFSLACQWPLIAALTLMMRPIEKPSIWLAPLLGLVALAAMIHPYIAAMVLLITTAAVIRLLAEGHVGVTTGMVALLAGPAVLGLSFAAIGLLSVGGGAEANGFQDLSFNLVGLFNPGGLATLLLHNIPVFPPQEFEGYAYLGLGVLLLLAVILVRARRLGIAWRSPRTIVLIALMLVCLIIALSNRITLGRLVLFTYPLPGPMMFLANAFRGSARFIWPDHILITAFAAAGVARVWPGRSGAALLIAAVLIQFFDTAGLRSMVRDFHAGLEPHAPMSADWSALGAHHDHLVVLPAWQCGVAGTPGGATGWSTFGRIAADQHLTINSYKTARYAPSSLAFHCQAEPEQLRSGETGPRTAYVLDDALFLQFLSAGGGHDHRCRRIDGVILCTADGATATWAGIVAGVPPEHRLDMALGGDGVSALTGAWREPDADGTWSSDREAEITLAVAEPGPLRVTVELKALLAPSRLDQTVRLLIKGSEIAHWTIDSVNWVAGQTAIIPAALVPADGILTLTLAVDDVATPDQLGYRGDFRRLGIELRGVTVTGL